MFQPVQDCRDVNVLSGKKLFKGLALFRRLGMKRKGDPLNPNPMFFLESVNTPGTEVAPGSDII